MRALGLPFETVIVIIIVILLLVIVSIFVSGGIGSGESEIKLKAQLEQMCAAWRAMGCEPTSCPSNTAKLCSEAGIESLTNGTCPSDSNSKCYRYCCGSSTP